MNKINHFIVLVLENRSFDHMLGYLSLDETEHPLPVDGLRSDQAWKDSTANCTRDGTPHPMHPISASEKISDPPHGHERVPDQINTPADVPGPRRMGGFVQSYIDSRAGEEPPRRAAAVMGYYDKDDVWAYDSLARNYCVCDRWFTPLPTGTQPNRLMAMGGDTRIFRNSGVKIPEHDLVYNWLSCNRVDWRVYTWGGYPPFFMLMWEWWDNVVASERRRFRRFDRLEQDWLSGEEFPSLLFIEPKYSEIPIGKANDDHAPTRITGGQRLVADLYGILTGNEERWAKTLLIVTYDEHGGFFDHVPPLPIMKQVGPQHFPETGPRVPALLISPHVDPGRVFREPVDHTAFLALLAERFTPGLPYSDAVAERQSSYAGFGRLSAALRPTARAGTPARIERPLSVSAMSAIESVTGMERGLASMDDAPDADTPTAVAFDRAARRTAERHPELLADPDWSGLAQYVAAAPAPAIRHDDHIGDD